MVGQCAAQRKVNKFWTKAGLINLGALIRGCREAQNLPLRDAAQLITQKTGMDISYRTLATVENASSEPKYNTLAAIAAAGFVKKNGCVLNIFDFIAIASESEESTMNALAQLIEDHLTQNQITLEEFAKDTGVKLGDLQAIMRGEFTKSAYDMETDLILIAGHLVNPITRRKFHTFVEMCEYCGLVEVGGNWEQRHEAQNSSDILS